MSFGFHDRSSGAGLFELTRHPFGALAEARAVILSGGDRGHPQELLELAEEGVSLAVHVLSQVHPRKSFLLPSERVASSVFRAIDDRGPLPHVLVYSGVRHLLGEETGSQPRATPRWPHSQRHGGHDPDDFFGLDVNSSPRAQLTTALAVLIPVALAGVAVLTLFSSFWWLIFVFGWTIFPAFGLLVRGSRGSLREKGGQRSRREQQGTGASGALREYGELSPAQAAMETSLSVTEADRMLKELAEGGHLDVRVRGGGLFYSLWERDEGEDTGRLEGR